MTDENRGLPPCLIYIDKDGCWYHKGQEMIRRDIVKLFYQNMTCLQDGTHIIELNGQRCFIELEDTAFVIWSVAFQKDDESGDMAYFLKLSDDSREMLNPETLVIGTNNVLYCRVKDRKFPARFNRASYYQLADFIEEDQGSFYLPLNGKKYYLEARD